MKKNIVLADCKPEEVHRLLDGLNSTYGGGTSTGEQFECISEIANGARTGKLSELKRYFAYFATAWKAFLKRKQFGVILGWQQFHALIFCFYCCLFHVNKVNTVMALNFTYKRKAGFAGKVYERFMRQCVCTGYLDYIHVLSNSYADLISEQFGYPRNQIIVTGFGVDDVYPQWKDTNAPHGLKKDGYVMSIGRSNRDFDFLIEQWKKINFPLVIISDTYQPTIDIPSNVTLLSNVSGDAQYPYNANARLVVIPILDGQICSGDTVLLTALSFERTVVVTEPSALGEMYIEDGKNAYLLRKDDGFANGIMEILQGSKKDLGLEARESYQKKYSRYSMGVKIAKEISQN